MKKARVKRAEREVRTLNIENITFVLALLGLVLGIATAIQRRKE